MNSFNTNINDYTINYMKQYGINNVRGGKYTNPILNKDEIIKYCYIV